MATCTGTTRQGKPCKAGALSGSERCAAHPVDPDSPRFGSPEQASAAGRLGGRPRNPRAVDVLRERIEQNIDQVLNPLWDALKAEAPTTVGYGRDAYVEMVPDYRTQIAAVKEILDRGYGKAKTVAEISAVVTGGPEFVEDPELAEEARALLRRAAGSS